MSLRLFLKSSVHDGHALLLRVRLQMSQLSKLLLLSHLLLPYLVRMKMLLAKLVLLGNMSLLLQLSMPYLPLLLQVSLNLVLLQLCGAPSLLRPWLKRIRSGSRW